MCKLFGVLHIICSKLRILAACSLRMLKVCISVQYSAMHSKLCIALRMLGVRGTGSGGAVCGQ